MKTITTEIEVKPAVPAVMEKRFVLELSDDEVKILVAAIGLTSAHQRREFLLSKDVTFGEADGRESFRMYCDLGALVGVP